MTDRVTIVEQKIVEFGDIRDAGIGCGWWNLELTLSDETQFVLHNVNPDHIPNLIGRKAVCEGSMLMVESKDGSHLLTIGDAVDYITPL